MAIDHVPIFRRLLVPYTPLSEDRQFMERAETQSQDGLEVTVAVLDAIETRYQRYECEVQIVGLDLRSSDFHERLSGKV